MVCALVRRLIRHLQRQMDLPPHTCASAGPGPRVGGFFRSHNNRLIIASHLQAAALLWPPARNPPRQRSPGACRARASLPPPSTSGRRAERRRCASCTSVKEAMHTINSSSTLQTKACTLYRTESTLCAAPDGLTNSPSTPSVTENPTGQTNSFRLAPTVRSTAGSA